MADLLNANNLAELPDRMVCGYDDKARRIRCHDAAINCRNSVFSWKDMRQDITSLNASVTCPANYSPLTDAFINVGDARVPMMNAGYGQGVYDQTKIPCGNDKDKRYVRACRLNRYTDQTRLAKCYMGKMSDDVNTKIGNTLDKTRSNYGMAEVSMCPRNWKDPQSKQNFMSRYCSDLAGATGAKFLCEEWWSTQTDPTMRDNLMVNYCATPAFKNNPRCACINAKKKDGVPSIFSWAFDDKCGDPKNKAYRTKGMQNLTFQQCNQFVEISRNTSSTLTNNTIAQMCNINVERDGSINTSGGSGGSSGPSGQSGQTKPGPIASAPLPKPLNDPKPDPVASNVMPPPLKDPVDTIDNPNNNPGSNDFDNLMGPPSVQNPPVVPGTQSPPRDPQVIADGLPRDQQRDTPLPNNSNFDVPPPSSQQSPPPPNMLPPPPQTNFNSNMNSTSSSSVGGSSTTRDEINVNLFDSRLPGDGQNTDQNFGQNAGQSPVNNAANANVYQRVSKYVQERIYLILFLFILMIISISVIGYIILNNRFVRDSRSTVIETGNY